METKASIDETWEARKDVELMKKDDRLKGAETNCPGEVTKLDLSNNCNFFIYGNDNISGLISEVGLSQDSRTMMSQSVSFPANELNTDSASVSELQFINEDINSNCSLQYHWAVDGNLNPMLSWDNWDSLRVQDDFFNF